MGPLPRYRGMVSESVPSVRVEFDVAGVIAEASAYADAIIAGDLERARSYLTEPPKSSVCPVLDALPEPITAAEVVSLTVPNSGRSTTITRYSNANGSVLLLAVWVETDHGLMMREQRIAGV
jgi:hypothetical protein